MRPSLVVLLAIAAVVQSPRGSVTGRVIAASDERPVAGARIVYAESDVIHGAMTDVDGRFALPNLDPRSRYDLRVTAQGFLSTTLGYEPLLGGTPFVLPAGDSASTVVFRLHRGATIAGRVVDETGDPVVRLRVRAFRRSGEAGNRLMSRSARHMGVAFDPDPDAETDDRGEFRISKVEPGSYVVGAVDRTLVTFAPGATTLAQATAVPVGMDEDRSGVNIRIRSAASGAITGVVSPPAGAAAGMSTLWVEIVRDPNEAELVPVGQRMDAQGRFRFDDVPAGRYTVFVRPSLRPRDLQAWARAAVTVSPNVTTEQHLALRVGARVAGQLTGPFDPSSRLELHTLMSDLTGAFVRASPAASFAFSVPPGRYRWVPSQGMMVPGPRILRAYLGDNEITDVPLVVTAETAIDNVRLVVEESATITGTVRDADGRPTSAGAVILASADRRHWTEASNRIRLVRADVNGRFQERRLPAGRYRIAHVTRLSTGHIWEPSFLSTTGALEIAVAAGETQDVSVRAR